MTSDQVIASGLNCTHPSHVSELLDSLRPLQLTKPIIVKPNSGEDWESGVGWVTPTAGKTDTVIPVLYS